MKQFFSMVFTVILLSSFAPPAGIDEMVAAMKTGNTAVISKFFDNTVEITLPDKGGSYSKSQAEIILKDFFTNNPVKSFDVIHKGQNAGSQYCIGTLVTKSGSYRTTIYMKQKGDLQVLQELRFESR